MSDKYLPDMYVEEEFKTLELPETMSAMLTLALKTLDICEQHPNYEINMSYWHEPVADDICNACLVGSVIAHAINFPFQTDIYPSSFSKEIATKLLALNSLREGLVRKATEHWFRYEKAKYRKHAKSLTSLAEKFDYRIPSYKSDPKGFKKKMHELATKLHDVGL